MNKPDVREINRIQQQRDAAEHDRDALRQQLADILRERDVLRKAITDALNEEMSSQAAHALRAALEMPL